MTDDATKRVDAAMVELSGFGDSAASVFFQVTEAEDESKRLVYGCLCSASGDMYQPCEVALHMEDGGDIHVVFRTKKRMRELAKAAKKTRTATTKKKKERKATGSK
jgi:hypothetical protein